MAKPRRKAIRRRSEQLAASETGRDPAPVIHSSIYLPVPVHEALRKIAFDERVKIHSLVMEGIGVVLRRRGYPAIESLSAEK
jgi:hypothetical protein